MRLIGYSERALALMKTRVSPPCAHIDSKPLLLAREFQHWYSSENRPHRMVLTPAVCIYASHVLYLATADV